MFGLVVIKDKNVIVNVNERIKMDDAFDDMPNLTGTTPPPTVSTISTSSVNVPNSVGAVNVPVGQSNASYLASATASLPPMLITASWDAESETIADTIPYEDEYTRREVEGEGGGGGGEGEGGGGEGEGEEGEEGEGRRMSESATFISSVLSNGFEQDQLVRNLLDLINPPTNTDSYVGELLGRMMASTRTEEPSSTLERLSMSHGVLRALSSSSSSLSSYSISSSAPIAKSSIIDSFTGAPLPENAKTITFHDNEVYEVDGLIEFFVTTREIRSPLTGSILTEKEVEKLSDMQPASASHLLRIYNSSLTTLTREEKFEKPISMVKAHYFEETIYTMILHCLAICELDQVTNAHLTIQDFNKKYYPTIIRSFSGLALSCPTRVLRVSKNVSSQLKSVLENVNNSDMDDDVDDDLNENAIKFLYHPVVVRSVCHAITGVCNLASTQYFSAASPAKFASKICEVPVARIIQSQPQSRYIMR